MDWGFLAFLADPWFVGAWLLGGAAAGVLAWRRADVGRRVPEAAGALAFPPLVVLPSGRAPGLAAAAPAFLAALAVARLAGWGFAVEAWLAFLAIAAGLLAPARPDGRRPGLLVDGLLPAAAATAAAGVVTGTVTPLVVGVAPPPDTLAFWGFAAPALALALPAAAGTGRLARRLGPRLAGRPRAPAAAAASLAIVGLVALPVALHGAWLRRPIPLARDVIKEIDESSVPLERLSVGTLATTAIAARSLREGNRSRSTAALEAGRRAATVVEAAGGPVGSVAALDRARRELQNGRPRAALASLEDALHALERHGGPRLPLPPEPAAIRGVPVIDGQGLPIGKVTGVVDRCLELSLDRPETPRRRVDWPADALVLGGAPGAPLVAVPDFGPAAGTRPPSGCT